jgi:hypothetical protein
MAGANPCDRFLEIVSGDEGFTTRRADEIIHEHAGYEDMSPREKLAHHKRKQQDILARFVGCEKEIFNDPTVKYPFRKHFSGRTGTMSNILTSGYLMLYEYLLNGPLEIDVNPADDFLTLFYLASSLKVVDGVFLVDHDEFEAMKRILVRLRSMLPETQLFTEEWFHFYRQFLERLHREALEGYTYYRNNPERQSPGQLIGWKLSKLSKEEQEEVRGMQFAGSYSHSLYEYYPPYMYPNYMDDRIEEYLQKLRALEVLFTAPEEARQVDFLPSKPASGKKSTKKSRRGGSRRSTVKRKGNRLSDQRKQRKASP